MPQASDHLRDLMRKRFGDPISDSGPTIFLENAGYKLRGDFCWTPKPGVTCLRDMTRDEFDCLLFLIHEWDFGTLKLDGKELR